MKLSLKLQDDHQNQNPLLKAKLPITIFNQPFTSSLTTTTTTTPKDLSFCLSTNFPTGPSLKLSYTPSTSTTTTTTPFSLSLKSGLGLFGSPHNSPLIFSANFSLSSTNPTTVIIPTFSLHFKPQFGHFSLHRSTSSNPNPDSISGSHSTSGTHLESGSPSNGEFVNGFAPDGSLDCWQELKLEPCNDENGFQNPNPSHFNGFHSNNGIGYVPESPLVLKSNKKGGVFSGVAVKARTVLPVTKRVMVNLRWGVSFEADSGTKMPYLTVNKIGIERVVEVNKVKQVIKESNERSEGDVELLKGMCLWMRRDLEVLEKENREMMQCLEEMRLGVKGLNSRRESDGVGKKVLPALGESSGEFERWRSKKNGGEGNGQRELQKPVKPVSDVEAELQRAIKAASS